MLISLFWVYQSLLIREETRSTFFFYIPMKKLKSTTLFAISLFIIWGVITISLFFIDITLFILSLIFIVLFSIYIGKLSLTYTKESQEIKYLNHKLESALSQIENINAKNNEKEILLDKLLEDIRK